MADLGGGWEMIDRPGWIEALFRSRIGSGCCETQFIRSRQEVMKRIVGGRIPDDPGAADELRQAALDALSGDDGDRVEQALAFLLVVGRAEDAGFIEPMTRSSNDLIRKGAKACLFELRRR